MAPAEPAIRPASAAIRSRFPLSLAIAATLALFVAGCGSDDESSPSPSASATVEATRSPTPTPSIGEPTFDSSRALGHVRALSVDIGIRAAGTDGELRAANYIRDELAKYGYNSTVQPFPIEVVEDVNTSLTLLSPEQRNIDAEALGGSTNGTVDGRLLEAGRGFPQEFPAGTTDSIVLIERGEITFGEKVANATAAGAAGVIIYNNESGAFRGDLRASSRIPGVSISQEDGRVLLDLVTAGDATARLTVETRTDARESRNVVAEPPSGGCRLVVGGHLDSVPEGPGANDNASGTATVLEMARAMAADGAFDRICFVLFGSEEIGLLGSTHYVESLSEGEIAGLEGMLNFDMLGVGDDWPFSGSREIVAIAGEEAERLSIPYSVDSGGFATGGSDHASFIEAGVPAMMFNCFCDPNYHTSGDRLEFVSEQRLAEAGALGMATAQTLLAG